MNELDKAALIPHKEAVLLRPNDSEPDRRRWLPGLLLVAAVVLAYQPAWNAGFIWDDDQYVTQNPLLTAPDGLRRIWFSLDSPSQYFPLVYTTFRFERGLWGLNPAGYHWVNILLHAANALLLWRLLWRLRLPGCWLAAALFALHPVQVESVAWITEGKNVLTLLFSLLATLAWVEFIEDRPKPAWRFYALALGAYALALFSKTTACTLPAGLLLLLWWRRKPIGLRRLAQMIPFLAMGAGMGLVTVWWEQHHQGVEGRLSLSALERILIASRAVWFYIGKLAAPVNLCFSYPRWHIEPSNPLAYAWLVAGFGAAAGLWHLRRFAGRSLECAGLFYVATLGPLLGFFMLSTFRYAFVADHYQYVACIGPLALAGAGLAKGIGRIQKLSPFLRLALPGLLLAALATLTWCQAGMYRDIETLWRETLQCNPASFMAHNNLANLLFERGQMDDAIAHYRAALEIDPARPETAYNLGNALFAEGRMPEAIDCYRKALALEPRGAAIAYHLGNALVRNGQIDEAMACYRKALEIQPDAPAVADSLGNALFTQGRLDEALDWFNRAVERAPGTARFHSDLGTALVRKGRLRDAAAQYELALKLDPADLPALNNLAWLLAAGPDASLRNGPRAAQLAEQADRLAQGRSPEVLRTLSAAYAEAGRFPEAIAAAQRGLALSGDHANPASTERWRTLQKFFENHSPFRDDSLTNSRDDSARP